MSRLILDGWQVVIGIETHVQLKTRQKLFSRANTSLLSHSPNSRHNAFDAAFPGTLPKLNPKCLDLAVRAALALNCKVQNRSSFDRKHYFYSDQPVGYQITQHYAPFALNGFLKPPKLDLPVRIKQLQLEQACLLDTGKSIYNARSRISSIDLNRAGTGLLEIVTEPDLSSPEEAAEYVRSLQSTLRAMGVSDGNMEAGDLRCDVNVSMNRPGEARGTRCEIKNLNSVRFMVAAIHHEIERQKGILSSNSSVLQETRGFDENRFETYTIRSKEDAPDYRYMPDPNLGVLIVNDTTIERIRKSLPESPEAMRTRLLTTYGPHGVNNASIDVLMGLDASRDVPFDGEVSSQQESAVPYFEVLAQGRDPREVVNWYDNSDFVGTAFVSESNLLTKALIGSPDGRTHRPGHFREDDQIVWKTPFTPRSNEPFTFSAHEGNGNSSRPDRIRGRGGYRPIYGDMFSSDRRPPI
uniref:Aspartyl/Glutamyl-tRNA(Gln) amidotransferase subunit B/E catalytic domain-containing protein n=1 Tax=Moniliophthora roreri TaxID=221103 RepID=A0A0W0FGU5_MONRR